ncbi:MAG TPA: PDZ domain-containing protein, partial [Lacipirellulaceae bacterium]|nr:PDZ domain-containing protein [Lacipirellulaceae bacterium]
GGALVDLSGRLVGINTAIIGPSYQGISFAIPSEMARESYERLRKDGHIERGFLGIEPGHVSDELAQDLELPRRTGGWVVSVTAGTPAAAAGMRSNDVILSWNGQEFSDPTLLSRAIAATLVGAEVPVKVVRLRDGEPREVELSVQVAARPAG